jgi:hypothetical protein
MTGGDRPKAFSFLFKQLKQFRLPHVFPARDRLA